MRRFLIGLCLIITAVAVWAAVIEVPEAPARMTAIMSGGGGGVGVANSCPADGSPDIVHDVNDNRLGVGDSTDHQYFGLYWTAPTTKQICKVAFNLTRDSGTITGYTYTAKIWTLTGTDLNAVVDGGVSSAVAGSQDWVDTDVVFTFGDYPSVSGSTTYAITVEQNTISASDYITANFSNTVSGTDYLGRWDSASGGTQWTDKTPMIKIYYYD